MGLSTGLEMSRTEQNHALRFFGSLQKSAKQTDLLRTGKHEENFLA